MKSLSYDFFLNMWIMKRIDEEFLDLQVSREFITEDEKVMIMSTPQTGSY